MSGQSDTDFEFEVVTEGNDLSESIDNIKQTNEPTWKNAVKSVAGILLLLFIVVGGFVLLALLIGGVGWIADNVLPWVKVVAQITLFVVVPISLLLSIFKKSRVVGAIGLLISSYVWGLNLWLWALVIAYYLAGTFWLVVGLLLGGIGVVPIAIIASLISGKWIIAVQIAISAVVIFAVRGFSIFLGDRAE